MFARNSRNSVEKLPTWRLDFIPNRAILGQEVGIQYPAGDGQSHRLLENGAHAHSYNGRSSGY